ncbi:MAG: peptidase [Ignavibacteriae bacterium]|nr:peptidase [Ignavibacteriota bacterium]
MRNNIYNIAKIFILFISIDILAQEDEIKSELHKRLLEIPEIKFTQLQSDNQFAESFEIFITQPVDHLNPINGPKFSQRIYLHHTDFTKPIVIETDGYAINSARKTELAKILKCNELIVEHRYFGESKPDSIIWKYLNTAQAAADHNRIVEIFKNIYKGKWINTGISKGGQTSIFFKYYYPNAVDVWVPYVAPLNLEQEDNRIHNFLENVGTEECRNKIEDFQKSLLKKRNEILPMLENHMKEMNYTFPLGLEKTFEYSVMEYSFAFWQWGNLSCDDIPISESSPEELFKHLYTASPFDYFDGKSMSYFQPFFYQAYTEIGYYNYETSDFSNLLESVNEEYASNIYFAPQNVDLSFDKKLMQNINDYIFNHGNNMLYIYGENDPWSATGVNIGPNTNAVKMIKKGGDHKTRIKSFEGEQKEKIYSTLENWLDLKIDRE